MKTRKELCEWLESNANLGNGVWVVYNGGGISLVRPDDVDGLIRDIMSDGYSDAIECIPKGDEFPDFIEYLSGEEYNGTDNFYRVCHNTGYNQENVDIQVQYWE